MPDESPLPAVIPPVRENALQRDLKKMQDKGGPQIIQQHTDAEVLLQMMNKILSKDDIEQKSRLIFENVRAMCQAEVLRESFFDGSILMPLGVVDGIRFIDPTDPDDQKMLRDSFQEAGQDPKINENILRSLRIVSDEMLTRVKSVDGYGMEALIRLASSMSITMQQHQHEKDLVGQMIGIRGGMR